LEFSVQGKKYNLNLTVTGPQQQYNWLYSDNGSKLYLNITSKTSKVLQIYILT